MKSGKISTRTPPILNFRVRKRGRFKISIRVRDRVKDWVSVGVALMLGCGSLH